MGHIYIGKTMKNNFNFEGRTEVNGLGAAVHERVTLSGLFC